MGEAFFCLDVCYIFVSLALGFWFWLLTMLSLDDEIEF